MIIKKQEENKLLGRTEVVAEIAFTKATPSRDSVRKELAKLMKANDKLVIVKKIENNYGSGVANVYSNVYKKETEMNSNEGKYMAKRHEVPVKKGEEASEAQATPASEEKPEAKAEEVKKEEPAPKVEETKPEEVKEESKKE